MTLWPRSSGRTRRRRPINRTIEERLTKLPAEALSVVAKQIKQSVGEFDRTAGQLTDSYSAVAEQARRAIDNLRATISSATDSTTRAVNELSKAFSADYKWSIAHSRWEPFCTGG